MKRINTAIIGIGHLGARHLKVYTEQISAKVNLVGVCDIQADRTQRLASHYHIPFYKNYKDLLGKVEAVNICVPTVAHFAIAKFFLENNGMIKEIVDRIKKRVLALDKGKIVSDQKSGKYVI